MHRQFISLPLILISALSLSACSVLNFGSERRAEAEAADKAGRIDLAIGQTILEADPAYSETAIILPEMTDIKAWRQSGARASKASAHFNAAADLTIRWRKSVAEGSGRSQALTAPPVSDGTLIYLIDGEQKVKAFDWADGREVWQVALRSQSRRDKRALGGGVAIIEDILYVSSGLGFVVALQASTGQEIWRRALGAPAMGAPTVNNDNLYVITQNNEIFALNLADGSILWSDQAIAEPARVLGSPSVAAVEDLVVAPFSSGEVIAYLASNGRRLWTEALSRTGRITPISAINDIPSRPVLSGGQVFAANQSGVTVAIDGRTGQRLWAQQIGSLYAPVVLADYVFLSGVEGQIVCLSRSSGAVIWAQQLPQYEKVEKKRGRITYAGPILANGRVLIASSIGDLIALSPQTGAEEARLELGDGVFIEPIAVNETLVILTDEGRLIVVG